MSIRSLTLAALDEEGLRNLLAEGETLFVERKETVPMGGLGATVASFANTLGGWVLLGIANDGTPVGFTGHGRSDLQDHLRHVLRNEVDPLPPFAARGMDLDGVEVGVIRIYESVDTPHILRRTGALYIREPGGKAPVQDHRALIELARRGERAREQASLRLTTLPHVEGAMRTPARIFGDNPSLTEYPPMLEQVVLGTPLTVTPAFADRALSPDSVAWGKEATKLVFNEQHQMDEAHQRCEVEARQRGFVVTGRRMGNLMTTTLVVDAGGVVGARFAWRRQGGPLSLGSLASTQLSGLITNVAAGLDELGGHGRALFELRLRDVAGLLVHEDGGQSGRFQGDQRELHLSGDLAIPATSEEILELAERWAREVGRAAGVGMWEG